MNYLQSNFDFKKYYKDLRQKYINDLSDIDQFGQVVEYLWEMEEPPASWHALTEIQMSQKFTDLKNAQGQLPDWFMDY